MNRNFWNQEYSRTYQEDRAFTDDRHNAVMTTAIYDKLGLCVEDIDAKQAEYLDRAKAIDYHAVNVHGQPVVVQERVRRSDYTKYNDFTLRYMREHSVSQNQVQSEFFKMLNHHKEFKKPYYMIYGILKNSEETLAKYAVLDLHLFFSQYERGRIRVDPQINNSNYSTVKDNILYAGCCANRETNGSTFVTFDIPKLHQLFPDIVLVQSGYLK